MDILKKIFGTKNARDLKRIKPIVAEINRIEAEYQAKNFADEDFPRMTAEFKRRVAEGETLDHILPEAFALVKNACRHLVGTTEEVCGHVLTWDMVPFDCQLVGGIVLHQGKIAEMQTGEGKTLVATLPLYLNALAGKNVQLVTVNDYLALRDATWMGHLYKYLGLTVGCIQNTMDSAERRAQYLCDITYGTNSEFGFDYLRDNGMAVQPEQVVQNGHHFAIVDEVDSILIDEARTPLIISGPATVSTSGQYTAMNPLVAGIVRIQTQQCNELIAAAKQCLAAGDEWGCKCKLYQVYHSMPKHKQMLHMYEDAAIRKLHEDVEMQMLSEMHRDEGRALKAELYFTIDERSREVALTDKGCERMNPKDPETFVIPDLPGALSQLDGDKEMDPEAKAARRRELQADFMERSARVHVINQLLRAYCLYERDVDYVVQDNHVYIVDEFTGRILPGRRWSDGLHQAVEAKENVTVEAATQTFATITLQNYFRMYHKLAGMTGTAETEAGEFWSIYKLDVVVIPTNRPVIRQDNDDLIYKTKKAKYAAVINKVVELREAGRPVLVGTTDVDTSELLSRMLKMRGIPHNVLNAKQFAREAEIVAQAGQSSTVTIATNMAGRGTDIKLSKEVKDAGGLAIIGTERHDSRRVDRQLRGRAGRQGDPGSSTFYVSLEDKLMRLFGSERIAAVVDKLGMTDEDALESGMLSSSIEKAQRKVEENNFGIRKRLLEYDDVMNYQREAIYSRRRNAMSGERIEIDVMNMMLDASEVIVNNSEGMSYEDFSSYLMAQLSIDPGFDEAFYETAKPEELKSRLTEQMKTVYDRRMDAMIERVNPFVKDVYEKQGEKWQNIAVPITDGRKVLNLAFNLKKAYESGGKELAKSLSKTIILYQIDEHWKQQLRDMDDLRQSVQNAAYEQKDPLVVYKLESYNLFAAMLEALNKDVLSFLFRASIYLREPDQAQQARAAVQPKTDMSRMNTQRGDLSTNSGKPQTRMPAHAEKRVGRNDPCPCGSGLKYKNCHGKGLV